MRRTEFANEEYYHICNRGVDKRDIFMCQNDYKRFLVSMDLLNDKKDGLMKIWTNAKRKNSKIKVVDIPELNFVKRELLVEINVYCLNPNHFHFQLKQLEENGVQLYMHKLSTSYTNYFNKKYDRSGALFQGRYKSVHIDTNEYFLYLSAYINKNYFIHGYEERNDWIYSSLPDYLAKRKETLYNINMSPILDQFGNYKEYEEYIRKNALYIKEKKEMEKYILE